MEEAQKSSECWQHARAAKDEIVKGVAAVMPPEVRTHARAAKKEALLAVRSLIDAAIERIDKKQPAV